MNEETRDWLSLDEAAARWAVSRLRLREAIACGALVARRDNRGFWRVLGGARPDFASLRAPPEKLVEALFDEIEELNAALEERGDEVSRLQMVAARQHRLLERALTLVENGADGERLSALTERSQTLTERALTALEQRERDLRRMDGLMARALDTVAGLDAQVGRERENSQRQRALLDRVFEIARASLDRLGGEAPRPGWLSRLKGRKR